MLPPASHSSVHTQFLIWKTKSHMCRRPAACSVEVVAQIPISLLAVGRGYRSIQIIHLPQQQVVK